MRPFIVSFFCIDRCSVQFVGQFNSDQKKSIESFIAKNNSCLNSSLSVAVKKIKKRFPSVKKVELFSNAQGITTASIESEKPLLKINEHFILVDNGMLLQQKLFDQNYIKDLKHLNFLNSDFISETFDFDDMNNEYVGKMPGIFLKTALHIPSFLFQKYKITCKSSSKWLLQDKTQKNFFILWNESKIPNESILNVCNEIKKNLVSRKKFLGKKVRDWVADVRFEDQIILFAKAGGQ